MSYIYSYKECLLHPLEFLSWRQRQVICKWLVKNWEQLHSEWAHVEDTEACQTIDAHVNTEERTGQELLQLLWILTFLSHTWLTQSRWHLSLCVCVQKKRTYVWMCLMFNFYTISLSHTHTHAHTRTQWQPAAVINETTDCLCPFQGFWINSTILCASSRSITVLFLSAALSYVRSYSVSVCTRCFIVLHQILVLLGVPSPQGRSPSSRKGETKNN